MNEASQFGPPAGATALQPDPQTPEPSVLTAHGIRKSYTTGFWPRRRTLRVLRGADLQLRSGEIVGLVGENGSGRSTLMKILVGSLAADGGIVG